MLHEVVVEPASDEGRFQRLMQAHHYLGALPKIGETLWYVARWRDEWVALMSFSSPALKCRVRDAWIGWDFRIQYDRLHLVTNNSRFLILPGWHRRNLASRLLSLCERRLASDWSKRFGHPLLLLETFVDPERFAGTVYKAANWRCLGHTRGFRRYRDGYSPSTRKLVFVRPLAPDARARMTAVELAPVYHHGGPKIMIEASMMRALPDYFIDIPDPRRRQGRRHPLATVLALSAAAALCGMRSLKAKGEWVEALGEKARERFCCRRRDGKYHVPSTSVIRDVLVRVDPDKLDAALQCFNADYGLEDSAFAIDGKTLRGAVDDEGNQVHVISAVGHQTATTHVQKKVGKLPTGVDDEVKQTNEIGMVIPMLERMMPDISGKTFTVDALLTQRKLAAYLGGRGAFFTVKGNQPNLLADIELLFKDRGEPDFREDADLRHGRIEERWVSTDLNDYLDFPDVGQAFVIERHVTVKKTGKTSKETVYGITSHTPDTASPAQVLALNRGHWTVENSSHYILDWNWDEDRQRIRTGYGPENTTRCFAIGLIKAKQTCVASAIRRLQRSPRLVLDYLRMTDNTRRRRRGWQRQN